MTWFKKLFSRKQTIDTPEEKQESERKDSAVKLEVGVSTNESNVKLNTIEEPAPTINHNQASVEHTLFTFNVAGVTMKNDKNKDIQRSLTRYGKLYCEENSIDLYGGYSNKDILDYVFEIREFEDLEFANDEIQFIPEPTNEYDENAIKVLIDYGNGDVIHVGYVPKKCTKKLKNILKNKEISNIAAHYVGGKIKEIEYDFEKDKEKVVTNSNLSLGVQIDIRYN
ncbi:HIRAN domain-containing protein [Lysinibacillus sp. NPDC094403]|uniref:HIRAN domain-containing protein n=1 Tax=Lysinibacillus sp. NPDC094403 TaxID=3390581 RepID=UPI003D06DE5B